MFAQLLTVIDTRTNQPTGSNSPTEARINDATANFTIQCWGETFRVHKAVLVAKSEYFKRCLRFACGKEREENQITLDDEDPLILKAMLDFIYTGDYELPLDEDSDGEETLPQFHAVSLDPASEVNQPSPKRNFSKQRTRKQKQSIEPPHPIPRETLAHNNSRSTRSTTNWTVEGTWVLHTQYTYTCAHGFTTDDSTCKYIDTHASPSHMLLHAYVYAAADYFCIDALKDVVIEKFRATTHLYCMSDIDAFSECVKEVCEGPGEGLRAVIVDVLVEQTEMYTNPLMKDVLEHYGSLTLAVLLARQEAQKSKDKEGVIEGWQLRKLGLECGVLGVAREVHAQTEMRPQPSWDRRYPEPGWGRVTAWGDMRDRCDVEMLERAMAPHERGMISSGRGPGWGRERRGIRRVRGDIWEEGPFCLG